jgi:peptidyl-prolyl cis-trans isomerase B (cyclophilin B)
VFVGGLGGCRNLPTASDRAAAGAHLEQLARAPARSHFVVEHGVARRADVPLPDADPAATSASLVALLAHEPALAAQAAFDLGMSGVPDAAELIEKNLPSDAAADVVAAAAAGLATSKAAATERVLLGLAVRPSHPAEALDALFTHYRSRGASQPPPATLPDARLLVFATAPSARQRAAFGELARVIKDPSLIGLLSNLAKSDPDFEVRRAAIQALVEGPAAHPRAPAARNACLAAIAERVHDTDVHVVIAALRSAATYDDPRSIALLRAALANRDFNVRAVAIDGLGLRKAREAVPRLAQLARHDPSVSVRFEAATHLAAIDRAAALPLADELLAAPSPYVRTAGVAVLATSTDATAFVRLSRLAQADPSVRVREAAVDAFGGRSDALAREVVRRALADTDSVVVATACGVANKNKWSDLAGVIAAIPTRFPGATGADARAGALEALAAFDAAAHRPVFEAHVHDANPQVRAIAEKTIASLDQRPPRETSRGADLTGTLLPGGAPIFGPNVFLIVETDRGTMRIRLFPDQAPVHCAHVAALARSGFYDGLTWHRVVPDFVIQGGCPRGDGSGSAGVTLPLEPTRIPFRRGTLGMPRDSHPDSGGCQLFICHSRAPHLDSAYTAFGQVEEGLDVIDRIDVESKILHVRVEGAR